MNQLTHRIVGITLCALIVAIFPVLSDQINSFPLGGGYYPQNSIQSPVLVLQNGYYQPPSSQTSGNLIQINSQNPWIMQNTVQNNLRSNPYQNQNPPSPIADRIIVKYKGSARENTDRPIPSMEASMTQKFGTSILFQPEPMASAGLQVIQVPGVSVDSVINAYKDSSLVEYAEPDYRISLEPSQTGIKIITQSTDSSVSTTPDDPEYGKLWGLHNTGQSPFNGKAGADINVEEAWKYSTGSSEIVVAILDSGVDYTHPDLADNIWVNSGEIPNNGIDDDGNGFIDDIHGWNFQGNNKSVMDDNGHGTHCAGIVGAVGNNNIGVTGVNWKVRIMPLKFMDSSGNGNISDAVAAILYANQMGADVISCSWSGTHYSNALEDAISVSPAVIVCAAGNGGTDDDSTPIYPATNDCPNIITVAATDASDNLATFSNYGVASVDIAAPGEEIASTYPGNLYAYMSGTSMATPYVSGVAALLKSIRPTLTNIQIRSTLITSSDSLSGLNGKVSSQGRLNADRAVSQVSGSTQVQQPVLTPISTPVPTQIIPILTQSSPYGTGINVITPHEALTGNTISPVQPPLYPPFKVPGR